MYDGFWHDRHIYMEDSFYKQWKCPKNVLDGFWMLSQLDKLERPFWEYPPQ